MAQETFETSREMYCFLRHSVMLPLLVIALAHQTITLVLRERHFCGDDQRDQGQTENRRFHTERRNVDSLHETRWRIDPSQLKQNGLARSNACTAHSVERMAGGSSNDCNPRRLFSDRRGNTDAECTVPRKQSVGHIGTHSIHTLL